MTAKTALQSQKPKVQVAKNFVGVIKRDNKNRPTVLEVPGSQGKRYQVIIRRTATLTSIGTKVEKISTECRLITGNGFLVCQGNGPRKNKESERVCYHSQTAIAYCIAEANKKCAWCGTMDDAINLQRLHKNGHIYVVESFQSSGKLFLLVY